MIWRGGWIVKVQLHVWERGFSYHERHYDHEESGTIIRTIVLYLGAVCQIGKWDSHEMLMLADGVVRGMGWAYDWCGMVGRRRKE